MPTRAKAAGRRARPRTRDAYDDWINALDEVRGDQRAAFAKGNWAALYDAACAATQAAPGDSVSMPRWVADGLLAATREGFPHLKTPRGRGRHARWLEAYKADLVDWHRFDVVVRCMVGSEYASAGRKARRAARIRRARSGVADESTPHPWSIGHEPGDLTAFETAASILATSEGCKGSASAIRQSYARVSMALRNGEAWRYYRSWMVLFKGHVRSIENAPVSSNRKVATLLV